MKKFILMLLITNFLYAAAVFSQPFNTFELRYFSNDPLANGETDFKGPTSVFNTDQRVEFLKNYAVFAADFFKAPGFDHEVVSNRDAAEVALKIKPQPLPEYRNRINLDEWSWTGYRLGQEAESLETLHKYSINNSVEVTDGLLLATSDQSSFTWSFPGQSWRFSFTWKAKVPFISSRAVFIFSELEKITGAQVGFNGNGKFFYTTANNQTIETDISYQPEKWYHFKIEFDMAADRRKVDLVRYNLYIDDQIIADYVPLQRVVTGGVGYAQNFSSIAKINRLTFKASKGVMVGGIWGVGYQLTGRESYPYTVETFLDEDFRLKPSAHGWSSPDYDDSLWNRDKLPIVHGGERYSGEALFLRKRLQVGDYEKAFLNISSLDPGGEVWVNGKIAAVITERTPQKIDITSFLQKGSENLIAVKVNPFYLTEGIGEMMPHSALDFNIGWFAGGMSLDLVKLTHIHNAFVYTQSLEGNKARQMARVDIDNNYWLTFRGKLEVSLFPWFPVESAVPVAEASHQLELKHNISALELPFTVENPSLWTPETPTLYKAQFILKDNDGNIIDDYVVTTGIRTVDQQGGSFRLNGEISMLNGAQIMGYRSPIEDMIKDSRCPPDYWVAKEILQIKRMNGNLLRMHVHNWEFPARGVNDPRYAQYADQLGMMLIWSTPAWIRTGRGWGDVDIKNYPTYMKQVINHPSIVVWEVANHTQSFKGNPVSESDIYCEQIYNAVYPADPSRLISYNSYIHHFHYANDEGTIDHDGNPIQASWAWTAPNVTRGNQDAATGYGYEWSVLRDYPGEYRRSFLDSKERAYFNFEHQESIAQPNWELVKGKPWYNLHSYEWEYDTGSIGRRLKLTEWKESQAWQAFSAWEAIKKMRFLDYDGFSWCSLHGGANSVTYKKPLIDFTGVAKLAWFANKMAFQKTIAGSFDVDVVYGPDDKINPVIINWNKNQKADLTIRILDVNKHEVYRKDYKKINLEGGRSVNVLEPFKPEIKTEGYYFILYEISLVPQK